MIKFNSTHLIVGEIKQLLHDFNLPEATVWKGETEFIPNRIYIKDNTVYRSSKDGKSLKELEGVGYDWGDKLLNITHTLDINTPVYDSYTHKYLGEYLRFLRDYKNINLMSMYNCFSNEVPSKMDETVTKIHGNTTIDYRFNTSDSSQKIYMIPIKLGQVYTMSLNTSRPIEMAAGFYAHGELIRKIDGSFRFKSSCTQSEVFIYDGVKNLTVKQLGEEYSHKEDCLYLFLKLSSSYDSSIVVLEGDFTNNANVFINSGGYTDILYKPSAYSESNTKLKLQNTPSRLQLLANRSSISYPFADKLLQYLFSSAITSDDEIVNNIKKAQETLYNKGYLDSINNYGTWTDETTAACLLCSHKSLSHRDMTKDFDVIGFLDSDIETELGGLY